MPKICKGCSQELSLHLNLIHETLSYELEFNADHDLWSHIHGIILYFYFSVKDGPIDKKQLAADVEHCFP